MKHHPFSIKDSRQLKIFSSFSGGRSSAEMCEQVMRHFPKAQKVFLFANTGQEAEETLEFVRQCDVYFGLNVVWVEAVVHPDERKGCTHRIVSFATASREGEPYEEVIKKYGLPNVDFLHCTRELKTNPMYSYIRSIGWARGTYKVALGIRADEPKRINKKAEKLGIFYPLEELGIDKTDINERWALRPFQLPLKEAEGNCKWCFKKTDKKQIMNIKNHREWFDFPALMEKRYKFLKQDSGSNFRVIFRKNRDTKAMLALADYFSQPADQLMDRPDEDAGCSESCEAIQ